MPSDAQTSRYLMPSTQQCSVCKGPIHTLPHPLGSSSTCQSVRAMKIIPSLYCLGSDERKNSLYMFNTDTICFFRVFELQSVETDVGPSDMEGWCAYKGRAMMSLTIKGGSVKAEDCV